MSSNRTNSFRNLGQKIYSQGRQASIASYYGDVSLYLDRMSSRMTARMQAESIKEMHAAVPLTSTALSIVRPNMSALSVVPSRTTAMSAIPVRTTNPPPPPPPPPPSSSSRSSGSSDGGDSDDGVVKSNPRNPNSYETESSRSRRSILRKMLAMFTVAIALLRKLTNVAVETAKETVQRGLTGIELNLTDAQVRGFNLFDLYHGINQGTTIGAMAGLNNAFVDISKLNEDALTGLELALARDGLIDTKEYVMSGFGGKRPDEMLNEVLSGFFGLYKKGVNQYGREVGQDEAARTLTNFLRTNFGNELGELFAHMVYDLQKGYFGDFGNYTEWYDSTRMLRASDTITEGLQGVTQEINEIAGKFQTIKEKLSMEFFSRFGWFIDYINNLRVGMSSRESARLTIENQQKNKKNFARLEEEANNTAKTLSFITGVSEKDILDYALNGADSEAVINALSATYGDKVNGDKIRYTFARLKAIGDVLNEITEQNNSDNTAYVSDAEDFMLNYMTESWEEDLFNLFHPFTRTTVGLGFPAYPYGLTSNLKWQYADSSMRAATEDATSSLLENGISDALKSEVALVAEEVFGKSFANKKGVLTATGLNDFNSYFDALSDSEKRNLLNWTIYKIMTEKGGSGVVSEIVTNSLSWVANPAYHTIEGDKEGYTSASGFTEEDQANIASEIAKAEEKKAIIAAFDEEMRKFEEFIRENQNTSVRYGARGEMQDSSGKHYITQTLYFTVDGMTRTKTFTSELFEDVANVSHLN